MHRLFTVLLLAWAVFAFAPSTASARLAPVENVDSAPISVQISEDKVEKAIVLACVERGWKAQVLGPGVIEARLDIRTHVAIVTIQFDSTHFSIQYKDSENLNYRDGKIHPNYNKWVKNLERSIQKQIIVLSA